MIARDPDDVRELFSITRIGNEVGVFVCYLSMLIRVKKTVVMIGLYIVLTRCLVGVMSFHFFILMKHTLSGR